MSLLFPLYLAGAAAIGLPILFHLIRRRPKGETPISSVMFVRQSPPRLTRRSRLDQWPLLLIRSLALLLLALAFARPFQRSADRQSETADGRRVVLLLDTSASMRRTSLWDQSLAHAEELIQSMAPSDVLAIVTFSDQTETVLQFEESARLDATARKASATKAIAGLKPTWHRTNLADALAFAADLATSWENDDVVATGTSAPLQAVVVLISDLQAGSQVQELQSFAWPEELTLDVRRVKAASGGNASVRLLDDDTDAVAADLASRGPQGQRARTRVTNDLGGQNANFQLAWGDRSGKVVDTTVPCQVPVGQSRVVRMTRSIDVRQSLVLQGDAEPFDNTHYFVPPEQLEQSVLFLGDWAKQPQDRSGDVASSPGPYFYLQQVPFDTPTRQVTVESVSRDELALRLDSRSTPLVVLAEAVASDLADELARYVRGGGRLLYLASSLADQQVGQAEALQRITGDGSLKISEATVADYSMLGKLDFTDPLLAELSDPKFNDFSKIRVWAHRTISCGANWNKIVSFDDGDPALIGTELGEGRVWVLAFGWQPAESQLALSTKFVPIMFRFLESGQQTDPLGSGIELSEVDGLAVPPGTQLETPDGRSIKLDATVKRDAMERAGESWSADEEAAFKQPTIDMFEEQSHPLYSSARLWDDGVIDPRKSRQVLALSLR
ncbi:MAG: BatA domain-containing protein, partial [Planctomycetota bacterium]